MPSRRSFIASAAGAAVAMTASRAHAQTTKIRVGIIPIDAGAQAFYAEEMGFFRRAGLDVEIVRNSNGGVITAVRFIELTFPEMPAALAQGRVDAALIAEPLLTASKRSTKVLADVYTSVAKEFLISGWCATDRWADRNRDVVRRFADVMRETAVWANANHARSAEILSKYAKIDPKIVAAMTRARYAERLEPQADPTVNRRGCALRVRRSRLPGAETRVCGAEAGLSRRDEVDGFATSDDVKAIAHPGRAHRADELFEP